MKQNHITGFHQQQSAEPEKKGKEPDVADCVLDAYFMRQKDSWRWTSQDICDNVSETMELNPGRVTRYMLAHGFRLERDDDRLVWVAEEE